MHAATRGNTRPTASETPEPAPNDGRQFRRVLTAIALGLLFGLAHAIITWIAYQPWFALAAFAAPMPLLWLALPPAADPATNTPKRSVLGLAVGATLGTAAWWAWALQWLINVAPAGLPLLVLLMSAYAGLFILLARGLTSGLRGPLAAPATLLLLPTGWIAVELLRGQIILTGFPWFYAGHPLINTPPLLLTWPARIGGALAVSWLTVFAATAIAMSCRRHELSTAGGRAALAIAAAVALAWPIMGVFFRQHEVRSRAATEQSGDLNTLRVAVVQSNIPQDNKIAWTVDQRVLDWLDLRDLTTEAARTNPDVIAWPETMFPGFTLAEDEAAEERRAGIVWRMPPNADPALPRQISATAIRDELLQLQQQLAIPMLVGATSHANLTITADDAGRIRYDHEGRYNSVFLIEDGAVASARYDKLYLTPFGEVLPYISAWPWLEERIMALAAGGMSFDLSPGGGPHVFEIGSAAADSTTGTVRIVTPICFEATVAPVCRRLVFDAGQRRAGVMINATNDGWFGDFDPGREHHLLMARWRCVELATPMVRAANTGVSAAIDATGSVTHADAGPAPRHRTAGVLTATIEPGTATPAYAIWGDWPGLLALGATAGGLTLRVATALFTGRRRQDRNTRFASTTPDATEGDQTESAPQTQRGPEK